MEKTMSVNGFIGSLPKIRKRRIWSVSIDGTIVQCCSATDNSKTTAQKYIDAKYPGKVCVLKFVEWRMWPSLEGIDKHKNFDRILEREREKRMFEVGEKVVVNDDGREITGKIVSYHYDEGNVWTVKTEKNGKADQFVFLDCYEKENGILAIL